MNAIYRIVWNAATHQWIVASELAKGRKKSGVSKRGGAAAGKLAVLRSGALAAGIATGGTAFSQPLPVTSNVQVSNGTTFTLVSGADIATSASGVAGRAVFASSVNSKIVFGSVGGTGTILNVTTTGADSAHAVSAESGGAIVINGDLNASTLGGTGTSNSHGVHAGNAGSQIEIHGNATVSTAGSSAIGLRAYAGGTVTVDGLAKVTTTGDSAIGLRVEPLFTAGTAMTVGSVDIETFGVRSAGMGVGGSTPGGASSSLRVLDSATVTTHGLQAQGVASLFSATLEIGGALSVQTTGDFGYGVVATGSDSTISVNGPVSVNTTGRSAVAVSSAMGGLVNLDGTFDINTSGSGAHGVLFDGAGSDVKLNDPNGRITVTGDNAYAIVVASGGAKTFDGTSGNILPGDISVSGAGSAVVAATGSGYLTLANSVALDPGMVHGAGSWGILADAGTVLLQDSASSGGAALHATNAGRIILKDNSSIDGSHVELTSGGTLDATGHVGGVAIGSIGGDSTGQLMLGDNGLTLGRDNPAGTGSLIDGASFAGDISGNGGLVKDGTGTQILSGNLTYTGDTVVNQGSLVVDGTLLPSNLYVSAGGTLGGNGTIGNLTTGGTLDSNLTITGDLTVKEGARIVVAVDPTEVLSGHVNVQGAAVLEGGYVDVRALNVATYNPSTHYTILTAGDGVSGEFEGATSNLAFLTPTLSYDPNTVQLSLWRNDVDFSDFATSPNQTAVANAIEGMNITNPVHGSLVTMTDEPAAISSALEQLSGQVHGSAVTVLVNDSRFARDAVNSHLRATASGARSQGTAGPSCATTRSNPNSCSSAWVQAFGSSGDIADGLDRSISGFFMGADKEIGDTWRVGMFGGYTDADFDVDTPRASGSASSYHLGIYGGAEWGNLGFRTGLAYSRSDIDTRRSVAFNDFSEQLRGSYHADTIQAFGELGYKFNLGAAVLEPFVNLAYVSVDTDSWKESGGDAALNSSGGDQSNGVSTLGVRGSADIGSNFSLWGSVGWQHVIGSVAPKTRMAFNGGSDTFSIYGAALDRDVALIQAGGTYQLSPKTSIDLGYRGAVGSNTSDHGGQINLRVMF